jgi:hypothetical protein
MMGVILSRNAVEAKNLAEQRIFLRFFGLRPQNDRPLRTPGMA